MYQCGKINDGGFLELFRKKRYKAQYCPKEGPSRNNIQCGDWCPLFEEPQYHDIRISLKICDTNMVFKEFEDER